MTNSADPGLDCCYMSKLSQYFWLVWLMKKEKIEKLTWIAMKGSPSDGIFNSNQTTITDSFSCILFFQQLHLGLNMCYFINFTLK